MPKLIRMVWDCPACGRTGIISTSRQCTCGYVFGTDPKDKFRMPADGEEIIEVTDADNPDELIENWRCEFCGSYNKYSDLRCTTCGHPRDESASSYFTATGTDKSSRSEELSSSDIYEGSENIYEDASKTGKEIDDAVHKRGEKKSYKETAAEIREHAEKVEEKKRRENAAAAQAQQPAKGGFNPAFLIILAAVLLAVFFLPRFLNATKEGSYTVTGKTWERAISIEKEQTLTESGWSLPPSARLIRTAREIASYRQVLDHYETVTVTKYRSVPHTETYYEDLGNGNAEQRTRTYYTSEPYEDTEQRPVYRSEPVYGIKYYYYINRYVYERSVETSGTDDEPYWGDPGLKDKERENGRSESYSFTFDDSGETHQMKVSLDRWKEITTGKDIQLTKTRLGRYDFPDS